MHICNKREWELWLLSTTGANGTLPSWSLISRLPLYWLKQPNPFLSQEIYTYLLVPVAKKKKITKKTNLSLPSCKVFLGIELRIKRDIKGHYSGALFFGQWENRVSTKPDTSMAESLTSRSVSSFHLPIFQQISIVLQWPCTQSKAFIGWFKYWVLIKMPFNKALQT